MGDLNGRLSARPGVGDISCAMARQDTLGQNNREPWSNGDAAIGGKHVDVAWAGGTIGDKLAYLKVKEPASPFTFQAYTPGEHNSAQIIAISPDGVQSSVKGGRVVAAGCETERTMIPTLAEMQRGKDLLAGVMESPDYKSQISAAGIINGQFQPYLEKSAAPGFKAPAP